MPRPANPNSPTVLLVAEDRALLRHLSRFLNALGYSVEQVAETHRAAALIEIEPPQLMIVDAGRSIQRALDFCRQVAGADRAAPIHLLLLTEEDDLDVTAALEAGVDDFLARPLVYGELLARLRAGVRAWEFERRARAQQSRNPVTGLPGAAVFAQRLRRASATAAPLACVVFGLDFFRPAARAFGSLAAQAVLRPAAEALRKASDDTMYPAALGGDRFACLLPGRNDREAADWAEQVRKTLAETTVDSPDAALSLSASFGVAAEEKPFRVPTEGALSHEKPFQAPAEGALSYEKPSGLPDQLIARAEEALRQAKQSGGNCVIRYGEFNEEEVAWAELAAPGKLFERTFAHNVMTPCPLVVHKGQSAATASALLDQTQLEVLAVVNDEGRYQGAVTAKEFLDHPPANGSGTVAVGRLLARDVPAFDLHTPFAAILEFFAQEGGSVAVIVDQGKPVGSVSAASLAGLTRAPEVIPAGEPRFGSDYLLVPESLAAPTSP